MITENYPLLIGLIAGIIYAMCTGQILLSIGVTLAVVIIVTLLQWGYRKNAKRLILKRLEVTTSEESPKPDGKGSSYYIIELKVKKIGYTVRL